MTVWSQPSQQLVDSIFSTAFHSGEAYSNLRVLCKDIGGRLSGSENAEKAVQFTATVLEDFCDEIDLQPVMVPTWVRGDESIFLNSEDRVAKLTGTTLGGSVATPQRGITGEVVEVTHFGQLEKLGRSQLEGKIVFYNRPMNPGYLNTFQAYSGGVDQRWAGAIKAAEYGAVGTLVRSLTLKTDDNPHTGSMGYVDTIPKIPSMAISTQSATNLHNMLAKNSELSVTMKTNCETRPDSPSHNVIGELKGSEYPDSYIVVGGHLDSWDLGEGAHDDGAGSVQAMEALRLLKAVGYEPRHTIRCVLFMNEENGMRGARAYADSIEKNNEIHVAALEADRGGFLPTGFDFQRRPELIESFQKLAPQFLNDYGLYLYKEGGTGADISQIKDENVLLLGLKTNNQSYFDYHHAPNDVFESVNERELEMGAAALASMIYLIDSTIDILSR
jgi:hypothetical protein